MDLIPAQEWFSEPLIPATRKLLLDLIKDEARQRYPEYSVDCYWVDRRPGFDPYPNVDERFAIVKVVWWRTIVEEVSDATQHIALREVLPKVTVGRQIGDPWYENLVGILVECPRL